MGNKKVKVYTAGDSHAWHAWLDIPGVITRTIGPMTLHRCGLDHPIVVRDLPEDSICVFCWGEIDCRCHVYKFPPFKETIDTLVKNYVDTIRMNEAIHKNIWIYNVVPPPRRESALGENKAFPFLGSNEERLFFVQYMNQRLKETGYPFLDIYWQYADKDGYLNMAKSDNHVHIRGAQDLQNQLDVMLASRGLERDV